MAGLFQQKSNQKAVADKSLLVIVDLQDAFLAPILRREEILKRTEFLLRVATLMNVPVIVTEQNNERMGATNAAIKSSLPPFAKVMNKMGFSAYGAEGFQKALNDSGKEQVILCGIESHICVTQSCLDLIGDSFDVFLAMDAISCRSEQAHDSARRRMVGAGAIESHTESIVYEWMGSSEHFLFREILQIVKSFS